MQTNTGPGLFLASQIGSPTAPNNNAYEGPGIHSQGWAILDPRAVGLTNKLGTIPSFMQSPSVVSLDYTPAASAATPVNISAAANAVSGTAVTLAAGSTGIVPNIPFLDYTGTKQTSGLTLDFGFSTLNCTSGSATIAATAATIGLYSPGQWLVIANVGNSGGTIPLITRILSISGNNLTVNNAPLATNSTAPVGQANVLSLMSMATPVAWTPYMIAGPGRMLNPRDGVSRGIGIAGSASSTGGVYNVSAYDIYGYPVTMAISAPAGATVVYGLKTIKHIMSITPAFSDAHTYSIGTSDLFGFNIRCTRFRYADIIQADVGVSTLAGFTTADQTSPATNATGDVRGTYQFGSRGPGAGGGSAISGTANIFIQNEIDPVDQALMKNANPVPFIGVTQV